MRPPTPAARRESTTVDIIEAARRTSATSGRRCWRCARARRPRPLCWPELAEAEALDAVAFEIFWSQGSGDPLRR